MKTDQLQKIQECAEVFIQTIQKYAATEQVLVGWVVIQPDLPDNNIAMGTRTGKVTGDELLRMALELNGSLYRLYDDFDNED